MQSNVARESLGDLGQIDRLSNSTEINNKNIPRSSSAKLTTISEANAWKINAKGKVELLAQNHNNPEIPTTTCR